MEKMCEKWATRWWDLALVALIAFAAMAVNAWADAEVPFPKTCYVSEFSQCEGKLCMKGHQRLVRDQKEQDRLILEIGAKGKGATHVQCLPTPGAASTESPTK